jgi:hypothetical protein
VQRKCTGCRKSYKHHINALAGTSFILMILPHPALHSPVARCLTAALHPTQAANSCQAGMNVHTSSCPYSATHPAAVFHCSQTRNCAVSDPVGIDPAASRAAGEQCTSSSTTAAADKEAIALVRAVSHPAARKASAVCVRLCQPTIKWHPALHSAAESSRAFNLPAAAGWPGPA